MERRLTSTAVTGIRNFVALAISLTVVTSFAKPCEDSTLDSCESHHSCNRRICRKSFGQSSESKDQVKTLIIPDFLASEVLRSVLPSRSIVTITEGDKTKRDAVCFTHECSRTASRILKNMNPEIRPCDDLYKFVCGGFENSTNIPDDQSSVNVFSMIHDKLQKQLRASIQKSSGPGELKPFTLAKTLYKACMNITAIEKAGLEPLRRILKELGKWPVIEGDNWKDEFHWAKSVYQLQKLGFSMDYFIALDIDVDLKNGSRHAIFLDVASLGLSREYLLKGLDDTVIKGYFEYMVNVAVILGADRQRATRELKQSLEFEIKLAKISLPSEKRREPTRLYNPMTLAELTERYPIVDWKEYINELLPPSIRFSNDDVVVVRVPSFIRDLVELLRTTPKRVQANYVMWRVAGVAGRYLSEDVRKIRFDFATVLYDKTEREARWKECVDIVADGLSIGIGALYVREYFGKDAKVTAVEMVTDIRKEFAKILEKNQWMDAKTRNKALGKVASMSSHIAYPDELFDDKKIQEFYISLELRDDDFMGNIQNVSRFVMKNVLEKLGRSVNKSEWISHAGSAVVNAYYSPIENSIQFPAGILQGGFFNNERPRYMNYGAMGSIIGHEITHGFDDQGRQFDKEGNLVDWWTPETEAEYLKKAECIIHQYDNYTVESIDLNLNGFNTLGENIADHGGVKAAYLAYKEWMKRNGPEPKLPGLNYTPEQMFWISAASNGCSKYRPEELKLLVKTDVHSPGQFRVLGPVSNMPEFTTDFNCPVGSAMNPIERCSVW